MSESTTSSITQPIPRVESFPRVYTPLVNNGRRITRSISSMLSGDNNINSNHDHKKDANRGTHKSNNTQPLPRVQKKNATIRRRTTCTTESSNTATNSPAHNTRSKTRATSKVDSSNTSNSSPAYNTRSKTATPKALHAVSAKARHREAKKTWKKITNKSNNNKGIAQAVSSIKGKRHKQKRFKQRMKRLENEVQQALAVMDQETGKMLNYRQLMRHPDIEKHGPSHRQMNLADWPTV